jgi:ABC-type transport system involved in multi-copper enzyme maturation permease subunit
MDTALQSRTANTSRLAIPPVWRLTATELRKMVDTRGGIALLVGIELLVAALVVVQLVTGRGEARTFSGLFTTSLIPVSIFLPVLGILSVTSEWSQRTVLTTFALVPRRWRVLLAKVLGAAALALLAVEACLATAAAGNALGAAFTHGNGSWHFTGRMLGGALLAQLLFVLMGIAFGLLLKSSPLAIVIYFVIPNAWTVLGNLVSWLRSWAAWLDLNTTTGPLLQDASLTAQSWAKVAASVGLWVLLPLGVGLIRLLREEVK